MTDFDAVLEIARQYDAVTQPSTWAGLGDRSVYYHRHVLIQEVDRLRAELLTRVDAAAATDDDLTVACPACGRPTAITPRGKLYTHRGPGQYLGQLHRPVCQASGRTPDRAAADEHNRRLSRGIDDE